MITNPLLAQFLGEPCLVAQDQAAKFQAALQSAVADPDFAKLQAASQTMAGDDFWPAADSWMARYRPYIVRDGILLVPVKGVLLHDYPFQYGSYATGYDYIWKAIERGLDDANVKGIALLSNTPGGQVAGCQECGDRIYARRGEKPIRAFAHEAAYSAGYWLASAADSITVSRTGGVGSIGVVTMHADLSKMLDDAGIKITFIHAGKHKVDGNPYEALPEDVKARTQARIDELYTEFVSTVARNRGMDEQAVRDTEALCFTATHALSNGLADAIGPLDDALVAFATDLSQTVGDEEMSTVDTAAVEQAALDTARKEGAEAGKADGAKAMQARIGAILGSEEAKGREDLAQHFAFSTDMPADAAVAALAKAPKAAPTPAATTETPAGAASGFDAAMEKDAPNVGGGSPGADADADSDTAVDAEVAALRARATAHGLKGYAKS